MLKSEEIKALLSQIENASAKIEGVDDKGFVIIHSKGDKALFRLDTPQPKRKIGVLRKVIPLPIFYNKELNEI